MIRSRYIFLLVVLTAAGCSSSKPAKDDGNYYLGAFEDFDSEEHPDVVPPPPPTNTSHVIPTGLEGRNEVRRPKQGHGYRVHLFASRDKRLADAELQRAIAWWERYRGSLSSDPPPIYVDYEQPFFKVRLGDYRSRTAATADAEKLARTFRGAFVVPATINFK
ncbi:MAG: SPOR domain-containing protein [Rhodothermia bacterium]